MSEELKNDDWEALMRLSHTLRGSCSTLGAPGIVNICEILEQSCDDQNIGACELAIEGLNWEFALIGDRLQQCKNDR